MGYYLVSKYVLTYFFSYFIIYCTIFALKLFFYVNLVTIAKLFNRIQIYAGNGIF